MSTNNDGGPAFPTGNFPVQHNGLSMLDWFAGQAMLAIMPFSTSTTKKKRGNHATENSEIDGESLAKVAYELASDMIAERARLSQANTGGKKDG